MKHLLIIAFLLSVLTDSESIAQMGHGMMRGMPGGTMNEHMRGHEDMMNHEQMIGSMTDIMRELADIMSDMSKMMQNMPKYVIHQMPSLIRDICSEMNRLSEMMDRGTVSDEEIKSVHDRILDVKRRLIGIRP